LDSLFIVISYASFLTLLLYVFVYRPGGLKAEQRLQCGMRFSLTLVRFGDADLALLKYSNKTRRILIWGAIF